MTRSKIVQQFGWSFCCFRCQVFFGSFLKTSQNTIVFKSEQQKFCHEKKTKILLNGWRIALLLMQGFEFVFFIIDLKKV